MYRSGEELCPEGSCGFEELPSYSVSRSLEITAEEYETLVESEDGE